MLAITEIKVSELICGKFVPAKHGTNKGELILLRESVLKEEGEEEKTPFFHQLRKLMETNCTNKGAMKGGRGGGSRLKLRKKNNIVKKEKSGGGGEIYPSFTSLYLACIPNVSI